VALYPADPKAADGYNWLGEALLHRGAYDEAADVLLTGYQNYADSPARPDLLLKLGVALAGAGETATACKTFAEVGKRYPDQPAAFVMRLGEERAKAQCPA
jgi:tol-pal system protein YbgF